MSARPVLVYDGDCGFCTRAVEFAQKYIPFDADVVAWQFAELEELGVEQHRAEHEILWVTPVGTIYGGHNAVAKLFMNAGGPWAFAGGALRVQPVSIAAHGVYRLVADNRDRMPGGTPSCAMPAHLRPDTVKPTV
ncbi:thiol-disulfide oxidoreductase DCC family protein [Embleya sp. NBC_00896]|uniref:thiol-disulfide oxidoreductase DCC family protein n=1 Tax=Embleya sp. NBC_00896 TaxID=2975961 RepID=UPI00386A631B|nr:DUF393 domain-containing protein [Embleya sp. NBC_00896]